MKQYMKVYKFLSIITAIALVITTSYLPTWSRLAFAGTLTSITDTMSDEKISVNSSHTVKFTVVGAVNTSGQKIIIAFPSGFDFTGSVVGDLTFTHGATTGTETNESSANLQAGAADASHWGSAFTDGNCSAGKKCTLTLTAPTDGIGAASLAASDKVIITYASTHSVNPSSAATAAAPYDTTITTTTNDGSTTLDSGTFADAITAAGGTSADVSVTATVNAYITFSNTDDTVGFGALSSTAPTYANGAATGSASDVVAHTFTIATNAPSGYTLTYSGANLTSGANTIPTGNGTTTITNSATGSAGVSQFAIDGVATGTGTMASGYNHSNGSGDWKFVPNATTTLASSGSAVSGDTIAMHYLSNITGTQAPGSYSTTITYIATGNF